MHHKSPSAAVQIRNLLFVIGSGTLCACALAWLMIVYYGPSGSYLVRNALLSPDLIQNLTYNETLSKNGASSTYVFDKIEFSYFDETEKKWIKLIVPIELYRSFYQRIESEKSLLDMPDDVVNETFKNTPASLSLIVHAQNNSVMTQTFQEVQFPKNGDYYRITLREQTSKPSGSWIYYYHPGIYKEALQLFTSKLQ